MTPSLFVSACLVVLAPASAAQDPKTLAEELLTQGAALFDRHDAAAMAATYAENGEIQMLIKEESSNTFRRDTRTGRAAVQEAYAEIFKDMSPSTRSRNVVESARFIGTGILVIQGSFQPDTNKGDGVPFVQVRVRQGGTWKILSVNLYVVPQN
jgi:hypothetical protein